ncbi:TFPI1 inhibitor, partial [Ptilonorhynchus violaceus]|nr:TFPI1 inhibitor [Ptilonorhynchus violaceus]
LPPLKLRHSFCAMKADDGPCKAIHIRYFFNIKSRKCEVFEYGGCHGNENNFRTLEDCQKMCVVAGHSKATSSISSQRKKPEFCFHDKDPGICRGYFSRYFYNKETKLCEVFKYGGCLGNQNNFKNLEECQSTCQDNCKFFVYYSQFYSCIKNCVFCRSSINTRKWKTDNTLLSLKKPPPLPSFCMTPMDRGLCRAKELRFFYNYSTGRCRPFSYSGCGGNENNFISRKSCLRICKK